MEIKIKFPQPFVWYDEFRYPTDKNIWILDLKFPNNIQKEFCPPRKREEKIASWVSVEHILDESQD